MQETILQVEDLSVYFGLREGLLKAVNRVSFEIRRGETLGLVGESGCGKTVSSLAIIGLLDTPPAMIHSGRILFDDQDLLRLSEREMSNIRGSQISMVFQEPMTSLNPVISIGIQISEILMRHLDLSPRAATDRAVALLKMVGIPSPEKRIKEYPHQLSGGMRQRVMIAMALACDPKVLIADEPTTALDVTIQAQILDLLVGLQDKLGASILLITHDLAVIADTTHRVAVMYAGKIVEEAEVTTIFQDPLHPYTKGLLRSIPRIDRIRKNRLMEIPGTVPNLCFLPSGCAFADRCPQVMAQCRLKEPSLAGIDDHHFVSCWIMEHD